MVEKLGVRLKGVTITRATAFNAKYVVDNGIGPGAIVKIQRSGDVIPYITKIIKKVKPQLPPKSPPWEWRGVDIVLINPEKEAGVGLKQIVYFFNKLGVDGLKEGVAQRLIDAGLDNIHDIAKAPEKRLVNIVGANGRKIFRSIKEKLSNAYLPAAMGGSGILGLGLGETLTERIYEIYPDMEALSRKSTREIEKLVAPLIGANRAKIFSQRLPEFYDWLGDLPITFRKPVTGGNLSGESVVFTGFRNRSLEQEIKQAGGHVGTSISHTTTILLVENKNSTSSKAQKARQMGIKIMDEDDFRSKYGL